MDDQAITSALELGQFELWCQPHVAARDGRVTCVHTSVRWRHPDGQLLPLATFANALDSPATQRMFALHMLCDALAALRLWQVEGFELDMVLALPLPVLDDRTFLRQARDLRRQAGILPPRLVLRQGEVVGCCEVSDLLDWLLVREACCDQAGGEFIVAPQPMLAVPAALRRWQASYAVMSAAEPFS